MTGRRGFSGAPATTLASRSTVLVASDDGESDPGHLRRGLPGTGVTRSECDGCSSRDTTSTAAGPPAPVPSRTSASDQVPRSATSPTPTIWSGPVNCSPSAASVGKDITARSGPVHAEREDPLLREGGRGLPAWLRCTKSRRAGGAPTGPSQPASAVPPKTGHYEDLRIACGAPKTSSLPCEGCGRLGSDVPEELEGHEGADHANDHRRQPVPAFRHHLFLEAPAHRQHERGERHERDAHGQSFPKSSASWPEVLVW